MRTRCYPARLPHYTHCTCTPQNVGPESGRRCLTHYTLRMHNTMVVKGWPVGSLRSEALGGSGAQQPMSTKRVPKGRWIIVLLFGERFTRVALLV